MVRKKVNQCLYCNSHNLEVIAQRIDGVTVVRCLECGLAMTESLPDDINSIYEDRYFIKVGQLGLQQEGYDDYERIPLTEFGWRLQYLNEITGRRDGLLLDIGCATGKFLEVAKDAGWEVQGVEISSYAVGVARSKGLPVYHGSLENAPFSPSSFDVITAFDLLEHLVDLRSFLNQVRRLLAPMGVFYTLAPNADSWRSFRDGNNWIGYISSLEHIYYFSSQGLRRILMDAFPNSKLTIITFERGDFDYIAAFVQMTY